MKSNRIELRVLNIHEPWVSACCYRRLSVLTEAERKKAFAYLREADRIRSIAGRLLIRGAAAERLGTTNVPIRLTGAGKPYLAAPGAFSFSLSHSGALVVLAAGECPVGVDVECIKPIEWRDIAISFGEGERMLLQNAPDPEALFYRIWTVREAFAKLEGSGLPLWEREEIRLDHEQGRVDFRGQTLFFRSYALDSHIMSVCSCDVSDVRIRCICEDDLTAYFAT